MSNVTGRNGRSLSGARRSRWSLVVPAIAVALTLVLASCSGVDDSGTSKETLATETARAGVIATNQAAAAATAAAASPVGSPSGSPVAGDPANGQALAASNGCTGCHSIDGSKIVGPTWKGLYGHEVELESGDTVTADDAYIHESILTPDAKVVKGFPSGVMPSFQGTLNDMQIADIIAYIKTLQ